ncbi:MAG: OmpA family protein [Chitinophagales bacterium]|nr:OmpA family protein [Chitinophagaceae bacterium]MCB9066086.1 OmpA family protein [Chitinophagales bacterium]
MEKTVTLLLLMCSLNTFGQMRSDTIHIYFELGKHRLTKEATYNLDSLAYNDILSPTEKYSIIGYTDYLGDEQTNEELSLKRANTIAEYITTLGISKDNLQAVSGKGEVKREQMGTDGYPTDRRVDIVHGFIKDDKNIQSKGVKADEVFDLENVFFEVGKARILSESLPALKTLLEFLQKKPTIKIQIEGHVHCSWTSLQTIKKRQAVDKMTPREAAKEIYELSDARAKAVQDFLIRNGIPQERLKYLGRGCEELEQHPQNNKRVAIRIIEK